MSDKSIRDARLAEIDRRLHTIQSGLAPAAEMAAAQQAAQAPLVPPEAAPVPNRLSDLPARSAADEPPDIDRAAALVRQLTALVDAQERLLASARELADRREPIEAAPSVSVSAGPFASTEALRRFEQALQALPDVRRVVVREYEGADRAIVDVHLSEPNT